MTEQEIIPAKRYGHRWFPDTIYIGEAKVNPDTLDCTDRKMMCGHISVNPPNSKKGFRGFWGHFFPIKA